MSTIRTPAPLEFTPAERIPAIAAEVRKSFASNKTKDLEWRLTQLRKLYWAFYDYSDKLKAAMKKDINKSEHESIMAEADWVMDDTIFAIDNLAKWAKDDRDVDVPLTYSMLNARIKKEPLGTVLIIGAFNFPVQLTLSPLVGAIAAGCTAVIKPSENSPATAEVMREMIADRLDNSSFIVVNGAIPETTALLNEKWDKIFYTGSASVGKIISKKAAETLTPVTLELGGKNPAFITKHTDLKLAARRLMWSKCMNAGQVCLSQNYVLVDNECVDSFITYLQATYDEFFPQGAQASPDLARIVNERQFDRLKKMLGDSTGKIVMGGESDRDDLFISPTVVLVNSKEDSMIQQESFGPIWSILPYSTLDEAIQLANSVDRTPLSLMTFGNKAENDKILNSVTSGGATINDGFFHAAINTLPFGGVGESGTGNYRGKASFDCFSHRRTIVETPSWMDKLLRVRYMPYSETELKRFQWMSARKPNFGRDGKQIKSAGYWLGVVSGLGGESTKGALVRWLAAAVAIYAAWRYKQT